MAGGELAGDGAGAEPDRGVYPGAAEFLPDAVGSVGEVVARVLRDFRIA